MSSNLRIQNFHLANLCIMHKLLFPNLKVLEKNRVGRIKFAAFSSIETPLWTVILCSVPPVK